MTAPEVTALRFGYMKASRKLFAHKYWKEKRVFCRFDAMLDLFQLAPWKEVEVYASGQTVNVPRGHVLVSVRMLADRWQWSNPKVVRFLRELVHDETLCTASVTPAGTLYRVVNYELYQGDETPIVTPSVTASERAANGDVYKKKEDKTLNTGNTLGADAPGADTKDEGSDSSAGGQTATRPATATATERTIARASDVAAVIAHYKATHPASRPDTEPNRKKVRVRLQEGYTVAELCEAIDGNARDGWCIERKKHEFEYVFRNSSHVDRFRALATEPAPVEGATSGAQSGAAADPAAVLWDLAKEHGLLHWNANADEYDARIARAATDPRVRNPDRLRETVFRVRLWELGEVREDRWGQKEIRERLGVGGGPAPLGQVA